MKLKKRNVLFTLLIAFIVTSCTEKIADELKKVDSQESSNSNQTLSNKGMRVVSTVNPGFSHLLHKEGNASAGCEILAPSAGWKASNYTKQDPSGTIVTDCILDVEELDLYQYGAKLKFDVDENLCEYVTYTPFRFFQYQPGISTKVQFEVGCDEVCGEFNEDVCNNYDGKLYKTFDEATNYTSSNHFFDSITGNPQTCQFDHSLGDAFAPNCDSGSVTTKHYDITSYPEVWCNGGDLGDFTDRSAANCETAYTWADNGTCDDGVSPDQATCEAATQIWTPNFQCNGVAPAGSRATEELCTAVGELRQFRCELASGNATLNEDISKRDVASCGGEAINCMEGPGTVIEGDPKWTHTLWTNEDLSPISEEVIIDAPYDKEYRDGNMSTNRYVSSYSRVCSSQGAKASYAAASFVGHEVENIPSFLSYSGEIIDSDQNGIEDYIILADHPFQGTQLRYSRPRYYVTPYYSFSCLDKSRDIKAQIRVHIREWDREFNSDSTYLNLVSDFEGSGDVLMDNDGFYDQDQAWNDREDWDDFLTETSGICTADPSYTNKYDCEEIGGLVWDTTPVFTNDDCSTLTYKPGSGSCLDGVSTTKAACLAAIPIGDRCRDNATFAGSGIVGGSGTHTTKASCDAAGGNWFPQPWDGDTDETSLNFPKSQL